MSLKKKTSIAFIWSSAQQFLSKGIGVIVTIILAKLLSPEDFGLIAMLSVFLMLAGTFMAAGFLEAVVRMPKVKNIHLNTIFYTNLVMGLIAYLILFISAPLIANFYEEPLLIGLIRVAGLMVIVNSFQIVQVALLTRALDFKTQLKAALPASLLSGIAAVLLAYWGYGAWALIAQMLLASIIMTILLWLYQRWCPKFIFSLKVFKQFFGFSYKLLLTSIINITVSNGYIVVIAKTLSSNIVGLYFFANKIKDLVIIQVVFSIEKVTYPALASIQNDPIRLVQAQRKSVLLTTFLLYPLVFALIVFAEPLFHVVLPEKWYGGIQYLQLICLAALFYPLQILSINILKVKGHADILLRLEIISKIMMLIVLFLSYKHGILGILIGHILFSMMSILLYAFFVQKLVGYSLFNQFKDISSALITSLTVALMTYFLMDLSLMSDAVNLFVFGLFALISYSLITWFFKPRAFTYLSELLKKKSVQIE